MPAGPDTPFEHLLRELAPQVLGAVAHRLHDFAASEDAVQEVFVECFRRGGALEAVGAGRVPGFRAFLYGVIRNVARRFESRPAPPGP